MLLSGKCFISDQFSLTLIVCIIAIQMLGLYWSWQKIGSPGMFTRIACCDMKHLKVTESACFL